MSEETPNALQTDSSTFESVDCIDAETFARFMKAEQVKVYVGPTSAPFLVHKDLLTCLVPFFKSAFNGAFLEASQGEIHLHDEMPTAFGIFLNWLYRGHKVLRLPTDDIQPHIDLYVMAEKWCMPYLQNAVLDRIYAWSTMGDKAEVIQAFLSGLVRHELGAEELRSYLRRQIICSCTNHPKLIPLLRLALQEQPAHIGVELAIDVLKILANIPSGAAATLANKEAFHVGLAVSPKP